MSTALVDTGDRGWRSMLDRFPRTALADTASLPRMPENVHIPKSASYTSIPHQKNSIYDSNDLFGLSGTISEVELALAKPFDVERRGSFTSSGSASPETEPQLPSVEDKFKRRANRDSKFSLKSFEIGPEADSPRTTTITVEEKSAQSTPSEDTERGRPAEKNKSFSSRPALSKSFSKLNRKSWISSRSPSPKKKAVDEEVKEEVKAPKSPSRRKSLPALVANNSNAAATDSPTESPAEPKRRPSLLRQKSNQLSKRLSFASFSKPSPVPTLPAQLAPQLPDVPKIPKAWSADLLPALASTTSNSERPPVPRRLSPEKMSATKHEPKKKDDQYAIFRSLDLDYQKFQAKTVLAKASIVRLTILPFLRNPTSYEVINRLRVEDLDRRVNILNRWWTGLLDMLNGKNNASVSGTDRPAILDAIIGIMERPEWRASPSQFCPLKERPEVVADSPSTSKTSLASAESDFLTESVNHNIRNMFIQNIRAQMIFVLDKMSLRTAPASIVQFCGRTCAYAFFFVPGAADILVRLWSPSLDTMRRVVDEYGISKGAQMELTSKQIGSAFPPSIQNMRFTTPLKAFRDLRKPCSPPLGTADLQWYGSWVSRWMGKETDLFYVFVKYYYVLVSEFLPLDCTKLDRICAPGWVMVQAQILTNIESTIHRHSQAAQAEEDKSKGASSLTFDDVLTEPDASISSLTPTLASNSLRLMAENRLIMLLRDMQSERCSDFEPAPRLFAESFHDIMKAAAKRTSAFDQNACYTLCDFLEESLVILAKYENMHPTKEAVFDWPFWLTVFKGMIQSHNTTIEIRLYAFLYSIWPTIADNTTRKSQLCLDFLLEPEFFESRFNHWCPMVRAYFMRLLCWRLGRSDSEMGLGRDEIPIFIQFKERLRDVWAHFIYRTNGAQAAGKTLPTTAPCNPAPYRRLLIIRTDPSTPAKGPSFSAFDQAMSMSPLHKRQSLISLNAPDVRPTTADSNSDSEVEEVKPRWGLLRTIISSSSSSKSRPSSKSPNRPTPKPATSSPSTSPPKPAIDTNVTPTHRAFCFRFSLEHIDRRHPSPGNMRLSPPRLPKPAQELLHAHWTGPIQVQPKEPTGAAADNSQYAGRALAEWTQVLNEYQNFFDRRRSEGVPNRRLIETPTLGVEVFRKPG